jgi:hypothetical protein
MRRLLVVFAFTTASVGDNSKNLSGIRNYSSSIHALVLLVRIFPFRIFLSAGFTFVVRTTEEVF